MRYKYKIYLIIFTLFSLYNIKSASDYYKQQQEGTLTSYGPSKESFSRLEGYHCSNGGDCPIGFGCSSFGLCERNE
jgi:hypothetical protein